MKKILLLSGALFFIGWAAWKCRSIVVAPFCSEEIGYQVYNQLRITLHGWNSTNAWIDKPSSADLDKEQAEINRINKWMKTADLSPCVRAEYEQWLTFYYAVGLREARWEIAHKPGEHEMDKYERDTRDLFERVKRREQEYPIPSPAQNR